MNTLLKIAIAEPSIIIRNGLEALLKKMHDFRFHFIEIASHDSLIEVLRLHQPNLLVINPTWPDSFHLQEWKEEAGCPSMKCVALIYSVVNNQLLKPYDEQFHIFDSLDEIKHKLDILFREDLTSVAEEEDQQTLSSREKEIVICVVKGMTNREIADSLFLSAHTVITHRRNIARKLHIHSPSGLTIYAIVNKLVKLEDLQ